MHATRPAMAAATILAALTLAIAPAATPTAHATDGPATQTDTAATTPADTDAFWTHLTATITIANGWKGPADAASGQSAPIPIDGFDPTRPATIPLKAPSATFKGERPDPDHPGRTLIWQTLATIGTTRPGTTVTATTTWSRNGHPQDTPDDADAQTTTVTAPDGTTRAWTFTLDPAAPHTRDQLAGVTATIDGHPIDGFDPIAGGTWTVTDPNKATITGIPQGWTMTCLDEPTTGGVGTAPAPTTHMKACTAASPDGAITVDYAFTTPTAGTDRPGTGDGDHGATEGDGKDDTTTPGPGTHTPDTGGDGDKDDAGGTDTPGTGDGNALAIDLTRYGDGALLGLHATDGPAGDGQDDAATLPIRPGLWRLEHTGGTPLHLTLWTRSHTTRAGRIIGDGTPTRLTLRDPATPGDDPTSATIDLPEGAYGWTTTGPTTGTLTLTRIGAPTAIPADATIQPPTHTAPATPDAGLPDTGADTTGTALAAATLALAGLAAHTIRRRH